MAELTDVTERAAALGFATTDDASLRVEPHAVRMLPEGAPALGVAVAGGVLAVLVDHVPSAAEVAALENVSGCAITVTVTTPQTFTQIATRARTAGPAAARDTAAILAEVDDDVTSIHLAAGRPPMLRTRTDLRPLPQWPALAGQDLVDAAAFVAGSRSPGPGDTEHVFSWAGSRWRAVVLPCGGVPQLVLRRVPTALLRLEELALPAAVADTTELRDGLVVLASPVDGGKSTTLAALLDRVGATRRGWITTLEAPVGQQLPARRSLVTQRAIGTDTPSVAAGVAAAAAAGSDVVAVAAPLLTVADVDAVLRAAGSGTLVLLTVPAASVAAALTAVLARVPDQDRAGYATLLAEAFRAGVAQQLLPTREGSTLPAVEVLWAHPAVTAVLRSSRLERLDAAAAGDPSGRSISMRSAVRALLASGRVADDAGRAWKAAHPDAGAALTAMLHDDGVVVDDTADAPGAVDTAQAAATAASGQVGGSTGGMVLPGQGPTRRSRRHR